MDRELVLLNRNIARLRRDVRVQSFEIARLIAAAERLMRTQADLVLFIERRERLMAPAARGCWTLELRAQIAELSSIIR